MSEPPHQVDYDFDYWMNTDLMDACLDPMHDGMGLNSRVSSSGELDFPPISFEYQTAGSDFGLTSRFDEGTHLQSNSESASMDVTRDISATETKNDNEYACQTCGASFDRGFLVTRHLKDTGHLLTCSFSGCSQKFVSYEEKEAHEQRPHTSGHGRTVTAAPFDCIECGESFSSKANLLRHAKEKQHQAYSCKCGAVFSRLDVLNRHLESLGTEMPKYPCKLCKRHRGANGFRRRDHLAQHERNYHHLELADESTEALTSRLKYYFPVCSHYDCPSYRDESFKTLPHSAQEAAKPFLTQGAFTKHMREEHNECTFPCDVQGCDRIGRRDYFREKDMIKHRRQSHPDASPYQPSKRELKYQCTEPGCNCNALLDPSSNYWHLWTHEIRNRRLENAAKLLATPSSSDAVQMQLMTGGSNNIDMESKLDNEQSFGF